MTISRRQFVLSSLSGMLFLSGCFGGESIEERTEKERLVGSGGLQSFLFQGKVFDDTPQVLYIQWVEANGQIRGALYTSFRDGNRIASSQSAFTGTHGGSGVTFVYSQQNADTGTLAGNILTVHTKESFTAGTKDLVFNRALMSDYNAAVAKL